MVCGGSANARHWFCGLGRREVESRRRAVEHPDEAPALHERVCARPPLRCVCVSGGRPAHAVRSERPAVKGTLQPVAAHRALREVGPQVRTLCIDGVRVPIPIAIDGNPPATELGRTNLPRATDRDLATTYHDCVTAAGLAKSSVMRPQATADFLAKSRQSSPCSSCRRRRTERSFRARHSPFATECTPSADAALTQGQWCASEKR